MSTLGGLRMAAIAAVEAMPDAPGTRDVGDVQARIDPSAGGYIASVNTTRFGRSRAVLAAELARSPAEARAGLLADLRLRDAEEGDGVGAITESDVRALLALAEELATIIVEGKGRTTDRPVEAVGTHLPDGAVAAYRRQRERFPREGDAE